MTVVNTFRTDDLDPTLLTLSWNDIRSEAHLWQKLFQLLHILYESQPQLGTIRLGELMVEMSQVGPEGDDLRVERWPIKGPYGLYALQQRYKEALADGMVCLLPITVHFNLEAYLFLPASVEEVRVLWYDSPDLLPLCALPIKRAPQRDASHFTRWQVVNNNEYVEAASELYIEIGCEWSPWVRQIVLDVRSRLDLWRPNRFDGSPNEPLASVNYRHLMKVMQHIAKAFAQESRVLPSVEPLAFAVW